MIVEIDIELLEHVAVDRQMRHLLIAAADELVEQVPGKIHDVAVVEMRHQCAEASA